MLEDQFLNFVKMIPLTFGALFPVINPLGTAILIVGMTGVLDQKTQHTVARSVAINSFLLMSVVLLAGTYLLSFFGITIPIVQAAGGLVLASMGWKMLGDSPDTSGNSQSTPTGKIHDQLFYPFTFPMTVGPGGVAVTLTLSAHSEHETLMETATHQAGVIFGIFVICVCIYICYAYSKLLTRHLGPSGTKVSMRLMAFILVCLGAQISWSGVSTLVASLKS